MRPVALLCALFAGCTSLAVVQTALEPYSVEVVGKIGGEVRGVWANARYVAVDLSELSARVALRGPAVYGGPIVVLREWEVGGGREREAWQIVLPQAKGEKTQLVKTTWAVARASMPHMPE